ncbi:MAG: TonB-dependent receptor plug domain-containing protein, partial [Caulobacteraceae bacterium]|nr:TonB-dependent receptor plug domain-containing protein [Caulobacteraceae bacterium]
MIAGSLLAYSAAMAQSTGSQTVEEVVVTAHQQKASINGLITAVEAPKAKSIVTQEYIATQQPGQNLIQDLNFVPGVNYTNDDPFGMAGSGGHLRVRGIDGSRIALLIDGVPLNDTGNYAIYPGELVDPEVVSQVNINIGSTDVDSPTASAVGGLINIDTLTPTDTFGGFLNTSGGTYNYRRFAGVLDTGEFGPFGTKMWFEGSDQVYNKYKGFGQYKKWQINTKVYQDLHHDGDFIAAALFWDNQRIPNLYALDLPTFGPKAKPADPWNLDYLGTYYSAGPTPGTAGNDSKPPGLPGNIPAAFSSDPGKYFYGNQVNPTNTWNLRGESRFTLLPNLHLTVDPAFQSVLADGGSQATTIAENDPRLIGTATSFPTCKLGKTGQKGVDLNGDGDCLDTVRVFVPSLTHTQRITVNTSLIWDINKDNLIQF